MVKVEKEITITITGRDAQYLSDICELARRYIDQKGKLPGWNHQVDEYTQDQISSIRMLMQNIFDAIA